MKGRFETLLYIITEKARQLAAGILENKQRQPFPSTKLKRCRDRVHHMILYIPNPTRPDLYRELKATSLDP